jgi:hypothetical protein
VEVYIIGRSGGGEKTHLERKMDWVVVVVVVVVAVGCNFLFVLFIYSYLYLLIHF